MRTISIVCAEVKHCLQGPQAGYVPKPEKALNEYRAQAIPITAYADPTLSPFATFVARFLMECETFTFMYKQHLLLLKLLLLPPLLLFSGGESRCNGRELAPTFFGLLAAAVGAADPGCMRLMWTNAAVGTLTHDEDEEVRNVRQDGTARITDSTWKYVYGRCDAPRAVTCMH